MGKGNFSEDFKLDAIKQIGTKLSHDVLNPAPYRDHCFA